MPILYNCRHDGDQFRVTKFNDDMNVESSYLCTESECDCPAGVRPICRHRQMLPKFLQREHVGDEWFFDFDRGGWVQLGLEWITPAPAPTEFMTEEEAVELLDGAEKDEYLAGAIADTEPPEGHVFLTSSTAEPAVIHYQGVDIKQVDELPPLPEGVTMIVMDTPDKVVDVHNAIGEALGEPPAPTHIKRRF